LKYYRVEIYARGEKEEIKNMWDAVTTKVTKRGKYTPGYWIDFQKILPVSKKGVEGKKAKWGCTGALHEEPVDLNGNRAFFITAGAAPDGKVFKALFSKFPKLNYFVGNTEEQPLFRYIRGNIIEGDDSEAYYPFDFFKSMRYATEKELSGKLNYTALQEDENFWDHLDELPGKIWTDNKFIRVAIKQHYTALKYISEELKTPELCLMAVKQYSRALKYVPNKLKNPELCLMAVKQNFHAFKYVPEKFAKVCIKVIK
jgi:hypothetical protein